MRCLTCDAEMTVRRGEHRYTSCGLPNIVLRDVEIRECPGCGEREIVVPFVDMLHWRIAADLLEKERLEPDEVAFLEKMCGGNVT